MPLPARNTNVGDDDLVKAVRWRYRICNYLFTLGAVWFAVGEILGMLPRHARPDSAVVTAVELIGGGIFSAAVAISLAIYRCPVCDRFLSRFRPRKDRCGHCGARVR